MDVSCVEYRVYRDGQSLYIDFDRIIPIAGMEEYQVRLEERNAEEISSIANAHRCNPEYRNYWIEVNRYIAENEELRNAGFVPNPVWAERGQQWYSFRIAEREYDFGLRLYQRGEVGVCVSINTRNQSSLGFYNLISGGDNRERIEEAFESDDVVWGTRPERTISVTFPWDRTNQRESIEWQFNTLMRVKGVLDRISAESEEE